MQGDIQTIEDDMQDSYASLPLASAHTYFNLITIECPFQIACWIY